MPGQTQDVLVMQVMWRYVEERETLPNQLTKIRRSVKVFAATSKAKVNSRHTCGGDDVKVSCKVRNCHISWQKWGTAWRRLLWEAMRRQAQDKLVMEVMWWYVVKRNTAISLDIIRRSVKSLAVRSNAKVNSEQTCGRGDVKVSWREKRCHISCQKQGTARRVSCEKQCEG